MSPQSMTVQKKAGYVKVSLEQALSYASATDPRYARKVEGVALIPPTQK